MMVNIPRGCLGYYVQKLITANKNKMKFAHLYLVGQLFTSTNAIDPRVQNSRLPLQRDGANCEQAVCIKS